MTIVATRSGKVEGLERDGVHVFRGVPYAAPPVGALRWHAPRREESWSGTRDAKSFSAQSAQTEFALELYRDHEAVAYVLDRVNVPRETERIALAIDDAREGPFVIEVRWRRFDGIVLTTARALPAGV